MKENVTCVIAPQDKESIMNVLEYYAIKKNVPLYRGGIDWFCERKEDKMIFKNNIEELLFHCLHYEVSIR